MNKNAEGKICCPKCGGTNLQAISDTHGKGASFWKLCLCGVLGLCGTGKHRQITIGYVRIVAINLKCNG